ncbi:hypothetical protein GLW08_03785 [Pontibacillus yanchengensis]|uniref:Uncharacterized protein n=3 Tax=Pontibacillus yanchengensis TaxID=462910 RepID=A0A0A2TPS4_9BACI|nr:hypothetical protein [Pontibacillus yanchengensis]KGP71305.1 hypothetical protein N782_20095 [Pontibacillus yanchengensis Y32]MYL35176.1 hypothetical protein [Pontibacillus yanchengensis]MYL52457.1 hypothetical protein [Pontibacillus yanchengensis]
MVSFIQYLSEQFDLELMELAQWGDPDELQQPKELDPLQAVALYEFMKMDWKKDDLEIWMWIQQKWHDYNHYFIPSSFSIIYGSTYFNCLQKGTGLAVWMELFEELVLRVLKQKLKYDVQ